MVLGEGAQAIGRRTRVAAGPGGRTQTGRPALVPSAHPRPDEAGPREVGPHEVTVLNLEDRCAGQVRPGEVAARCLVEGGVRQAGVLEAGVADAVEPGPGEVGCAEVSTIEPGGPQLRAGQGATAEV